jgi:hypothetical protein
LIDLDLGCCAVRNVREQRLRGVWILEAKAPEEVAVVLKECEGYYVLRFVECDGVPKYSYGGLYEAPDDARNHKFPEAAVAYGKALLAAAEAADAGRAPVRRRTLLSRLGLAKGSELVAIADQLDIVRAAARWFIFWGERGHPIAHGSDGLMRKAFHVV